MTNYKEKIQTGMFSVQKGLKKGKDKLENSQEIISLKFKKTEYEKEKEKLIITLGVSTYEKLKNKQLEDEDLKNIGKEIIDMEEKIDEISKEIKEKSEEE